MAEAHEIKIQLDEEVLKAQVRDSLNEVFDEFSMRLRAAANILDDFRFQGVEDAFVVSEYERGFEAGKASVRDE